MRFHHALLSAAASGLLLATAAATSPAQAAPDQTLGMALMSAVVASDGTLDGGAGVEGVDTPSTGIFEVRFVREVTGCTAVASPGVGPAAGATSFQSRVLNVFGNEVTVRTETTSDGTSIDVEFSLIVFCAR